jgi:hypothetical protein
VTRETSSYPRASRAEAHQRAESPASSMKRVRHTLAMLSMEIFYQDAGPGQAGSTPGIGDEGFPKYAFVTPA